MRLLQYSIFCATEESSQYVWLDESAPVPTTCPNDPGHTCSGVASIIRVVDEGAQKDVEGAALQRLKAAPSGWTYQLIGTEFETSKLESLVSPLASGTVELKLYNSSNALITDQVVADADCVKTILDWMPSYAYEIIGGTIKFLPDITEDVRLSVIAVPDVPAVAGGSKIMVNKVNLKFADPQNGVVADGRASKRMDPSVYNTTKLRIQLDHPAGHKTKFILFVEHFKV